jgi:hypothetical protein
MQHSPQIYEMLNELREDELRRVSLHRIEAMRPRSQSTAGMRASIAGAIVRVGLLLDRQAAARETDRSDTSGASPRLRAATPEGDPTWHW